jgi:DNA uptake protein ComE-like DNA-binding protein
MNFNAKPFKNWFGFSRRERRATFVLLIILVIIIGLRYIIPASTIQISDITGIVLPGYDSAEGTSDQTNAKVVYTAYHKYQSGDSMKKTGAPTGDKKHQEAVNAKPPGFGSKKSLAQKSLIDINTCDSAELVRLPGIGPVLSARIVKYRNYLGGYASTLQLKEVYGLSPETYELIRSRVIADPAVIKRIGINTADYREFSRVRYLEKYEISAILKYRELKGRIDNVNELTDNKLITVEKAQKVGPYLRFD